MRPQLQVPSSCHLQPGALPSPQTQLLGTSAESPVDSSRPSSPAPDFCFPFDPTEVPEAQSSSSPLSASPLSIDHNVSWFLPHPVSGTCLLLSRQPARSWLPGYGKKNLPATVSSAPKLSGTPFCPTAVAPIPNPSSHVTCQAPALMPGQLCQRVSEFDPCSAGPQPI